VRRLQTPWYEEARPYLTPSNFGQPNEYQPYTVAELEATVHDHLDTPDP